MKQNSINLSKDTFRTDIKCVSLGPHGEPARKVDEAQNVLFPPKGRF